MTENLLLTILTAALCENFVLAHLLGTEAALNGEEKPGRTLLRGLVTTVCMIAASLIAFAADKAIFAKSGMEYLSALVFAVILAVSELAAEPLTAKIFNINMQTSSGTRIFLNSAVFAMVLQAADCADWHQAVLFGLVSGIGFTLAALLVSCIRERLETADVPESFRNLPILILAAGLCAMIFTGFAGLSF
ncbi:MAG: hypothetical protein IJY35_01750 [Clostridia bacterium]|nr:hypothetical protein [Clostridia bacterium]